MRYSTREPGLAADCVADPLSHRSRDLDTLAELLTHLEGRRFAGGRLDVLQGRFASDRLAASRIIRRLHRLSGIHDSQKNTAAVPRGLFLYGAYSGPELDDRAGERALRRRFDESAITFDYRMTPGPVTRSNALALMRAVGLVGGSSRLLKNTPRDLASGT